MCPISLCLSLSDRCSPVFFQFLSTFAVETHNKYLNLICAHLFLCSRCCCRISCGTRLRCSIIHWLKKNLTNTSKWHVNMATTFGKPLHSHSWMLSEYIAISMRFFFNLQLLVTFSSGSIGLMPVFVLVRLIECWVCDWAMPGCHTNGVHRARTEAKEKKTYFDANYFHFSLPIACNLYSDKQSCHW